MDMIDSWPGDHAEPGAMDRYRLACEPGYNGTKTKYGNRKRGPKRMQSIHTILVQSTGRYPYDEEGFPYEWTEARKEQARRWKQGFLMDLMALARADCDVKFAVDPSLSSASNADEFPKTSRLHHLGARGVPIPRTGRR